MPEARRILGLGPEEDPRPHLSEFETARAHFAGMVKTAPNQALVERYQKGLTEFDEALAALRAQLSAPEPALSPTAPKVDLPPPAATERLEEKPRKKSTAGRRFTLTLILITTIAGAVWIYSKDLKAKDERRLIRIALLEKEGATMVENRSWQYASDLFSEIEKLAPNSDIAKRGRRSIEAGMGEEQTQFIGYWTGQATAELEAGRLEEAIAAAQKVLTRYPADREAIIILNEVELARSDISRSAAVAAARQALDLRDWPAAVTAANAILVSSPTDPDATAILATATAAIQKVTADQARANELLAMAVARDQGQFDPQALNWLREASSLDPTNPQIREQLEKLSNYTRTIHVPGDFATPAEALAQAQDRDRIVLAEGTWKGPLIINHRVDIQGAGFATTRIECTPAEGCAISIGPDAKDVRITGVSFRHESFAIGSDRFSVALIRGGSASFTDCRFTEASGHGLAVIEGGQAIINRCRFAENGWNGIAAIGKDTTLEVNESESLNNFEHGIESWNGAAITLINNRCEGNSRNGIHADSGLAAVILEGNQLIANREFGLVLNSASGGKISANTAHENYLGGIVICAAAANVAVTSNQATLNLGPGLILEKGLVAANYITNLLSKNTGPQILTDSDITATAEPPAKAIPVPENRESP